MCHFVQKKARRVTLERAKHTDGDGRASLLTELCRLCLDATNKFRFTRHKAGSRALKSRFVRVADCEVDVEFETLATLVQYRPHACTVCVIDQNRCVTFSCSRHHSGNIGIRKAVQ